MNDKQQLAAMGAEMAEQQRQPLCMAKRIEELETQVRVMAEALREAISVLSSINHGGEHEVHVEGDDPAFWQRGEWVGWAKSDVLPKLQAALAGKLPVHNSVTAVDWSSFPGWLIDHHEGDTITEEMLQFALADMLAAAPSPDNTK